MDKLLIHGGIPLKGEITVSGAKNAALPILCAGLLSAEPLVVTNVPRLHDVATTLKLLSSMGAKATRRLDESIEIDASSIHQAVASYDLVKTMRASILVLGPLLARFGEAKVSLPGGCAIGQRPVDQHIKGLQAMGAEINIEHGYIHAKAKRLKGARIMTDMVTVTGTENLMMAATLADGQTVLENAAREPEVVDLANCLIAMGAKIHGAGTDSIVIDGVTRLNTAWHQVMPDRIEAGTFLCAVAAVGGEVVLKKFDAGSMDATMEKLRETGLQMEVSGNSVRAKMTGRPKAVGFRTSPYPAFATDMQAQLMTVNCLAEGTAMIAETIFENRFMHVQELNRLGANIAIDGHTAVVKGVEFLAGANVMATDLRASASLVIAGMAARGQTTVERIYHLDRGYDKMEAKLSAVGAQIQRVSEK